MEVKGTLPSGIEFNGNTHRDFAVRPQKVRDSVDAYDKPRARSNDAYLGLCVLASQIVTIGTIPKEKITPELFLDASLADLEALRAAQAEADKQSRSFRVEDPSTKA